jgi:outer membrane protein assembly factor BamB
MMVVRASPPAVPPVVAADPISPVSAAVGDGKVVVPYSLSLGEGVRMACFDARTGVRLWDVELHKEPKKGLAIAAGRVYYATGAAAYALSLANGAPIFAVGQEL